MNTEITEVSSTRRELKIEIPAEIVKEAYNRVSQKYAKGASVPGFRKGFASLDVVRTRYKNEIRQDVMQEILPKTISDALQENDQMPISEPEVHLDDAENVKFNGSQAIQLHVHYEVMPEVPEPKYDGYELTRRVRPVLDGEIEDYIEQRRDESAVLVPVEDRKAQDGDTVIADLEGTFEGEPDAEPIKVEDLEVKLGDDLIEKSFSDNLQGVEEDDEKEFSVSYADDFSSPALAGKTVHYKAKVKSVGKIEKPALDDEWATSLDEEFESLEDLRTKLREDIEKHAQGDADARLRVDAVNKLVEENSFDVPSAIVENQAQNLLQNFAQDLAQRGMDLQQVEQGFVEAAYGQMRMQAERDVRGAMLLEKIADLENVEVSQEEIDEELENMGRYYGVSAAEILESLRKNNAEGNIAHNLRTNKAIKAIVDKAKITEGEWVEPQSPEFQNADDADEKVSEETEAETPKKEKKASEKKPKTTKEKTAKEDKKPEAKKKTETKKKTESKKSGE